MSANFSNPIVVNLQHKRKSPAEAPTLRDIAATLGDRMQHNPLRRALSDAIERKGFRPRKDASTLESSNIGLEMPEPSALGAELAVKAFQLLGKSEFSVSSVLSVDKPETLHNFGKLQQILLMAYEEGLKARDQED